MKRNFEEIVLTPEELDILTRLDRDRDWIEDDLPEDTVRTLRRLQLEYDLVDRFKLHLPDETVTHSWSVSAYGQRFLSWLRQKESDAKEDFRREVKLSTVNTVIDVAIGAVAALVIEHGVPALFEILRHFLQSGG